MRTNYIARMAAVLVALEGFALVGLVVWQATGLVGGDTSALETAIALIVLTVVAAAAVLAFAVAIWRGLSWGRSGAIVTQLLILAVALGAATGAFAAPTVALALAAPAVATLVTLVITAREAGRGRTDAQPR